MNHEALVGGFRTITGRW